MPVVAGKLQQEATKVKPIVLHTEFSDRRDEISIDLKPAYDVPQLKKFVRTLRFERAGTGIVTLEDEVEFSVPSTFETVLTTRAKYRQTNPQTFRFDEGAEHLTATVETPDGFTVSSEPIQEMEAPVYMRLGLHLAKPVAKATVRMSFRPD